MSLYDVPYNLDETGKLQHFLKTKDVLLCLCYQPPGLQYNHPNRNPGTYSQAVYVVAGDYTCKPVFRNVGIDRDTKEEDIIHIKAGEFVILEHLRNIVTHDTAGSKGVMMIHINPLSGKSQFDFEFIGPNENRTIKSTNRRKIIFTFKEDVYVNGVELSLLNRMRMKYNDTVEIETGESGACLVMENRDEKEL
jgi:anti-sigma regulatory factor (Ser/Thr protein kinase)